MGFKPLNLGVNFCSTLTFPFCIVLLAVISFIGKTLALYEDQIGKFDWRQQYVGLVKFGQISDDSTYQSYKRLFVATESNALASINTDTGELFWRQLMGPDGVIDDLLLRTDDVSIVHGNSSKILYNFDTLKGTLNWEYPVESEGCSERLRLIDSAGGKIILLVACNRLFAIDNSRNVQWTVTLPKTNSVVCLGPVADKSSKIVVIGRADSNGIMYHVNSKDGTIVSEQPVNVVSTLDRCLIIDGAFVGYDSNSGTIFALDHSASTMSPITTLTSGISKLVDSGKNSFVVSNNERLALIFTLKDYAEWKQIGKTFENVVDFEVTAFESRKYVAFITEVERQRAVSWVDLTNGDEISVAKSKLSGVDIYGAEKIFPVVFTKGASPNKQFRAIVLGADHALAALQGNNILWLRQEALSQIISAEHIDLPLSESQASVESEFSTLNHNLLSMFAKRLTTQARQIQRTFLKLANETLILFGAFASTKSVTDWFSLAKSVSSTVSHRDTPFERDYFNLHKVIVVVTALGKVFGLDNRNGKIFWQFYHPDIVPFGGLGKKFPLFIQRTTAHFPNPAQCVIVGQHKVTGNGYILLFDPVNGKLKKTIDLKRRIKQAVLLPVSTEDELFGLAFVTENGEVLIYPSDIKTALDNWLTSKPIYFFNVEPTTGLSAGYRLNRFTSELAAESNLLVYDAEQAWTVLFPVGKNGRIIEVKMKHPNEHVHSQGRVLGDRSVLYKYSNPNLVTLVVEKPEEINKNSYTIYLFDAVTGTIVFTLSHHRSAPPFHLVHCENWIIYTHYNEKARRTEFTVLELYEGKHQTDPDKFSSFVARPPPIVMRQSYIFPQGVSALTVTTTERGITSRHLIVALPFGGVLELHKAFLDPRRVLMPTVEEREEGLIPYMPDLPIATEHLINYNQSVFNIRAIHTAGAGLESTSLVLVYGLDLFYTRVHPSATFDILKDDFDHWFISVMLLGLFLASVLTKRLAKLRDLKLAWK